MKKIIFCFIFAFILSMFVSYSANAYSILYYHWIDNTWCTYSIGNDISYQGAYVITLGDNQWNSISNSHVYMVNNGRGNTIKSNTQNNVCDIYKNNMGAGYLAYTSLWYYPGTHHRGEWDIVINTYYPIDNSTSTCYSSSYHLRSMITHEMGHLVGLGDESSNTQAVMYYGLYNGDVRCTLNSDDITGYNNISWND
jgi:hypothetical protein